MRKSMIVLGGILIGATGLQSSECYKVNSRSSGPCDSGRSPSVLECPEKSPPLDCDGAIKECLADPDEVRVAVTVMHGLRSCEYTGEKADCCKTVPLDFCTYEQDYFCRPTLSKTSCYQKQVTGVEGGPSWVVVSHEVEGGTHTEGPQGCNEISSGPERRSGTFDKAEPCN